MICRKEGCVEALENDPPETTESATVKANFQKEDAKAQAIIVTGLSDKHLDIVKDCETAKTQIEALKSVFTRTTSLTKLAVWRRLINLKNEQCENMEDLFLKFDTIVRDLKEHKTVLNDSDKVCHLLLSLPERYNSVVTALETIENVKFDFVKSRLLDEELKIKAKSEDLSSFKASAGCFRCGSQSHWQSSCPKNKDRGESWRGRGVYIRGYNRRARSGRSYRGGGRNYRQNEREDRQAHMTEETEGEVQLYAANLCLETDGKITMVLDSGASNHFLKEELEKYMVNIRKLDRPVIIHIANGEKLQANKIGTLKTQCQRQKISIEALIVKNLKHNLLSASKLTSKGYTIVVERDKTTIKGESFSLKCEMKNGLYLLQLDEVKDQEQCNVTVQEQGLWHRRLGHPGNDALIQLGLPTEKKICSTCMEAKGVRCSFKNSVKRTTKIGELIHTDICGPFNPTAYDGSRYFQTIIDDYSHFTIVKTLKTKNEAEQNIKNFIEEVETQKEIKVKAIRADNGGEFVSNTFKVFCMNKGIALEYTMPHTPQENGTAERMNRTLLDKIRTKIIESAIPKTLWCEALKCSVYELNRLPTKALQRGMTPSQIWNNRNDLSKLRVFGCRSWYTKLPKGNKLDPRAKTVVMVGYCGGGYNLWSPDEQRLIKSRDVRFDESVMEFKERNNNKKQETNQKTISFSEQDKENENLQENDQNIDPNETLSNSSGDEFQDSGNEPNNEIEVPETTTTRTGRTTKRPGYLTDYDMHVAYCLLTATSTEPRTFQEANLQDEWKESIQKELSSHINLETWSEVYVLPENVKPIDTRWIFKQKEDGTKKSRLVAKGFQVPYNGEEFDYAPVCRISTIRLMLSIAVERNYLVEQIDVPTAFLNGEIDTDVYIKKPEGLVSNFKFFKLKRALYGLRNSPKCWNIKFNDIMTNLGFIRSNYDYCLYLKENIYLVLYVDDALIMGTNEQVDTLIQNLYNVFQVKKMTKIQSFLGMQFEFKENYIKVHQTKMIEKLLKEFEMEQTKPIATPMDVNFHISEEEEILQNVPYRRLICSLMYISITTRPDICQSVSLLSRYLDKPTTSAWNAGKRVLRYLNSTKNYGLTLKKSNTSLVGMCDADWGGDRITRKSVSGFIAFHNDNPIAWFSRKQTCVAISSMEAEYVAAAVAAQELVNLKGLLIEFGNYQEVFLKCDNLSAIATMKNFENSKRGKHIEIKYHFIKDLCLKKVFTIKYVSSSQNYADMFTKSLSKEKFVNFRNGILAKLI